MNRNTLIKLINKEMPEAEASPSEDFNGNEGGIWFRGSEDFHQDEFIYNIYYNSATMGVHVKLDEILKEHGWFAEPYDSGTLFAWTWQ